MLRILSSTRHHVARSLLTLLADSQQRVPYRYVGPDTPLLVAGFSWLRVLQPDAEHAGQLRGSELSAPEQAMWRTMHD